MNTHSTMDVYVPHTGWFRFEENDEVATALYQGHFEAAEQVFFRRFLRLGDTFVDAGAHAGLFSVLAGKIVGDTGRLLAFEPDALSRELLERNLRENLSVPCSIEPVGLWKEKGTLRFRRTDGGMSSHNSIDVTRPDEAAADDVVTSIEVQALDEYAPADGEPPWALLKVDCEGAETEIVQGARRLFKEGRVQVVMIEFNEHNLRRFDSSTELLYRAIEDSGLRLYRYDATANELNEAPLSGPIWYENLFACADPHAVRKRLRAGDREQAAIITDILQRARACTRFKELEDFEYFREQAKLAKENEAWARRTEGYLAEQKELANYYKDVSSRLTPFAMSATGVRDFNQLLAMEEKGPLLSVIICTHNPEKSILEWTFKSLREQTLEFWKWELILVDNNSDNGVIKDGFDYQAGTPPLRVVREEKQGLTHARIRGFAEARAAIYVLVDDDNYLQPDYLEKALEIMHDEPTIGAFGGISIARYEKTPHPLLQQAARHLAVRNHGDQSITSDRDEWGEWEPIGAGMVIRREVAEKFVSVYQQQQRTAQLGRCGGQLRGGEDSLLARCAYRMGFQCSYQPALSLQHHIPARRVGFRYLCRLSCSQGRTYVILNQLLGKPLDLSSLHTTRKGLLRKLRSRLKAEGLPGFIEWFWDIGYYLEARQMEQQP